jgi:FHA domain/IPT/TIG domain
VRAEKAMPDAPSHGASLTVLGGPLKGKTLLLEDAVDEILVGSDPDSRLCLDLPGVSPIHARIWLDLAGATVYDTRSARGVYINDTRVDGEAPMRDGDILWLGAPGQEDSVMIQFRGPAGIIPATGPPAASVAAPDQEPAIMSSDDEMAFEVEPPAPPPPAEGEPLAGLLDEFAFLEEPTAAAAPAPPPAATAPTAPKPAAVDEFRAAPTMADEFLVDTPDTPAEASWSAPSGEPALGGDDEAFFVDEPGPQDVSPMPSLPPEPPPLPETPPPIPRPAAPPPPAPVAAKPETSPPARRADRPAPSAERPPAAERPPRPRPERPPQERPRADRAHRTAPPAAGRPIGRYAAIGVVVLALLAVGGFFLKQQMAAPKVQSISPARVRAGEVVTVAGKNFSSTPSDNLVRFEGTRNGRVISATPVQLQVEVPDVPAAIGRPNSVPVTVTIGGRSSDPFLIAVYQAPRIHGLSPSVAMPGEEVVLAGNGWGQGASVRFGNVDVPIVDVTTSTIKVRVPQINGPPGTSVPVVVSMGADPSNPAPFILGRLPLILSLEPRTAGAGDTITIDGRGFTREPARDQVRIAGTRAVVGSSGEEQLKAVVPFIDAPAAEVPVEVRVAGLENLAQTTLNLSPPADPVDLRFSAEPFDDAAGHPHAAVTTALGPTLVLSAAGGRSAGERAYEAQRRLNEAAAALKASRDAVIEVRAIDGGYDIVLSGRSEPLVQVKPEDAAGYNEDWTNLKGKGGPVTPGRLASWWGAVLRDLVELLIRGEKPHFAFALAPDGRVLGDLFDQARKVAPFGVPRSVLAQARPPLRPGLRTLALRVPASVPVPAGEAAAAPVTPTASVPKLTLAGDWSGTETEAGERRFVTANFAPPTGSLTYQRALTITVSLANVEQGRDGSVRFEAQAGRGLHYYAGKWDGRKITGRIASDPTGQTVIGNFELEKR